MTRKVAIVDTHVVVAGLLTHDPDSPVVHILDGMLAASFPFALSEALLGEYRTVLLRPKLRKLHGLSLAEVETILTDLAQNGIVLRPVASAPAPDPGDQMLWDLLAARADLLLVSGDRQLLEDSGMRGRVVAPRAFLAALGR